MLLTIMIAIAIALLIALILVSAYAFGENGRATKLEARVAELIRHGEDQLANHLHELLAVTGKHAADVKGLLDDIDTLKAACADHLKVIEEWINPPRVHALTCALDTDHGGKCRTAGGTFAKKADA